MSEDGDSVDFRTYEEKLAEKLYTALCQSMGLRSPTAAWLAIDEHTRRHWVDLARLAVKEVESRKR